MLPNSVRLGFLLAALVASLHVAAAPRVWTLTNVTLSDGAAATGYLIYDHVTGSLGSWNVRVGAGRLTSHTHVPGNSWGGAVPPPVYPVFNFYFYSSEADPRGLWRSLRIVPLGLIDGSSATVAIDTANSVEFYEDYYYIHGPSRQIVAGSLVLALSPPPLTIVQVDEFYHPELRHYFITASDAEKQDLDTALHPGWVRTQQSFKAYAAGSIASGSINPVCRHYGNPPAGPDSHFFSAQIGECFAVQWTFKWFIENDNAFQIDLPDTTTGACPAGTIPVYRLWNQRADSNHRYTTSPAIKAQMLAAGYLAEGYGPDGVVMCAVQ